MEDKQMVTSGVVLHVAQAMKDEIERKRLKREKIRGIGEEIRA